MPLQSDVLHALWEACHFKEHRVETEKRGNLPPVDVVYLDQDRERTDC